MSCLGTVYVESMLLKFANGIMFLSRMDGQSVKERSNNRVILQNDVLNGSGGLSRTSERRMTC